jgi:hypothetical protein
MVTGLKKYENQGHIAKNDLDENFAVIFFDPFLHGAIYGPTQTR